jgi:chromosome segregation ATPase
LPIYKTYYEKNRKPDNRDQYINKSHPKATDAFLAEHPRRVRTMSCDDLTSQTTRHTFQTKSCIIEQSITIDQLCKQPEDDDQKLKQQVNRLYRLFDILEDRNQELNKRVKDLTVKNVQLQQQVNNTEERFNQLETTNQNLRTQINDLIAENEQQANNIDELYNQLEATNQNLGTKIKNLNEECHLLKANKEKFETKISNLDQQLKNHDLQFNEISMRMGEYKQKIQV